MTSFMCADASLPRLSSVISLVGHVLMADVVQ